MNVIWKKSNCMHFCDVEVGVCTFIIDLFSRFFFVCRGNALNVDNIYRKDMSLLLMKIGQLGFLAALKILIVVSMLSFLFPF